MAKHRTFEFIKVNTSLEDENQLFRFNWISQIVYTIRNKVMFGFINLNKSNTVENIIKRLPSKDWSTSYTKLNIADTKITMKKNGPYVLILDGKLIEGIKRF
jgi:hypothetical protein